MSPSLRLFQWLFNFKKRLGKFPTVIQLFLRNSFFQLIWLMALESGSFKGLNQAFSVRHPAPIPGTSVASSGCAAPAVPRGQGQEMLGGSQRPFSSASRRNGRYGTPCGSNGRSSHPADRPPLQRLLSPRDLPGYKTQSANLRGGGGGGTHSSLPPGAAVRPGRPARLAPLPEASARAGTWRLLRGGGGRGKVWKGF